MINNVRLNLWFFLRSACISLVIACIIVIFPSIKSLQKPWLSCFLLLVLIFGEMVRYFKSDTKYYSVTLYVSMAASIVLYYIYREFSLNTIIVIYFILLLSDIIITEKEGFNNRRILFYTHITIYVLFLSFTTYFDIRSMYIIHPSLSQDTNLLYLFNNSPLFKIILDRIYFAFFYMVFILIFNQVKQKIIINKELEEANNKIEELVLFEERNRMAQEIHDSIGHTLTALVMNLDYLEYIYEKDKLKSKETLAICQDLSRIALSDVRKVGVCAERC